MDTYVNLIEYSYNDIKQEVEKFGGQHLTLQFQVCDDCAVVEINGYKRNNYDNKASSFKHRIVCDKDQNLLVLNTIDEQVNLLGQEFDKDRIRFETTHEELKIDHGQFDEELFIDQKVIFNTKHLIRDTFNSTVLNELQELIVDVLANREDSQKEIQVDLEDLIKEQS